MNQAGPIAKRADAGWIDRVAVQRFLAGEKVGRPLTLAERQEVARLRFAEWVGVTARQLRIDAEEVRTALAPEFRRRERARRRRPVPEDQLRVA